MVVCHPLEFSLIRPYIDILDEHVPEPHIISPISTTILDTPTRPSPVTTRGAHLGISSSSPPLDVTPLAQFLVEQLIQHHGCAEHPTPPTPPPSHSVSLSTTSAWPCPDVLSTPNIAQHGSTDWETIFPVDERQRVYTGHSPSPEDASTSPPSLDLDSDAINDTNGLQIHFDIDSAGGFASSLAVAREGLKWKAGRAAVSNLQSSLHLDRIAVHWQEDRPRTTRQPLHQIPHLPFGRLAGFPEVEVYLIFPYLYHPSRDHWVITVEEYTTWTDHILLPAIRTTYPASVVQHLPASAQHITMNGSAAQIEGRSGAHTIPAYVQDLHYTLQGDRLAVLWEQIQQRIHFDGLLQFRDCRIVLTAKNLKLITQHRIWSQARDTFFQQWHRGIDPAYLSEDFYDIAKEVVPSDATLAARTLSWRRCCLERFGDRLAEDSAAAELPREESSGNDTNTGSASHSENAENAENAIVNDIVDEADPARQGNIDETSAPTPKRRWRQEIYPQSLVHDQCSMTIAPYITSPLWQRGLRYSQHYNTSKEVFAAGNQYLFSNENFDSLALDPAMLRTWQHVGGAISHSPLTLVRGYVHNKQRSHIALQACRDRSYSTREEYRVSGAVLAAIDELLSARGLADTPLSMPADPYPFWIHPTAVMLDWWRWNINKLCVGFEMTYSLRPRTVVHWEHTRVMMMFLKCLLHVYGGQGGHPRRSLGLWIDRRTIPQEGTDVALIQEGMAIGPSLQQSGYGWLANKLSWSLMVFLPSCRNHMVFNTPHLQSAYHERYTIVKQVKGDFLLFHDVFQRLQDHRADPRRSMLLLQLMVDLCLRAFRQDVFRALSALRNHQPFHADNLARAQAGEIPLDFHGMQQVFQDGIFQDDLRVVDSTRAEVSHIETLFVRLWGWDGDGNQGDWQRKHWEYKPYRVFFRQCFGSIAQIHSIEQAWEWRTRLKQTFIRAHWILPYPSSVTFWARSRTTQRLQIWSSVHPGVCKYCATKSLDKAISFSPAAQVRLPLFGWTCGPPTWRIQIQLPLVPTDLDNYLHLDEDPIYPVPAPIGIPLRAAGVEPSSLAQFCRNHGPERMTLRNFKQQQQLDLPDDQIHNHRVWLRQGLSDHIRATIRLHRQEINDRNKAVISGRTSVWRNRPRPALSSGLAQLHLTPADLEHDDFDWGNFHSDQKRHERRLRRMQQRLLDVEREVRTINKVNRLLDRHHTRLETENTDWDLWERQHQRIRLECQRKDASDRRLKMLSRNCSGTWE